MKTRSDVSGLVVILSIVLVWVTPAWADAPRLESHSTIAATGAGLYRATRSPAKLRVAGRKSRWRWDGSVSVRSFYDDNILDYSDRDRHLFLDRTRPNKFSITTLDDWVTEVGARVERRLGAKSRGEYRVRFLAEGHLYSRNPIRNSMRYEWEGRWAHRSNSLTAQVGWIPHFYLRDLTVHDSAEITPGSPQYANADYHAWSAEVACRFRWVGTTGHKVSTGWRRTDYGHRFDERDNTTWWGRYELTTGLAKDWRGTIGYEYSSTTASGAHDAETVTDISRREQTLVGAIDYDHPRSLSASIEVNYEHQRYTSVKSADPSHAGRRDDEWRLRFEVGYPLGPNWSLAGFDRWTAATSTAGQLVEFGAFDDNQIGLRMNRSW